MDKHMMQYNLAIKFIELGIDEKRACELAVGVEEMVDRGAIEVAEKICTYLEEKGVFKGKGDVDNG